MQTKLDLIEQYVYRKFSQDFTGHDYYHMRRVAKMAKHIAEIEGGDLFISEAAGWLHDIGDKKLFEHPDSERKELQHFLTNIGLSHSVTEAIFQAITDVSYSKGHIPKSLEGKIVQDADRIDAIGAIGIARTFAFGGAKDRLIHADEGEEKRLASIQHFHDKLLRLYQLMNTDRGRAIAKDRHEFMEGFLDQFYEEWGGR
ncbi:HD domain-containing protein [Aquibacillus salsiterrae]|uniref:HD domain-containing protein n=1 Tax=Aquibacillus salsiterrae TaxID=2950439 RepID=A0A9X4AET3_9BACI|nr:HD domain-containing protein [Aquibacillus salsiterrae]MDC3415328.1 HD domain-containing protein [Aquibacillus salsiterrae]